MFETRMSLQLGLGLDNTIFEFFKFFFQKTKPETIVFEHVKGYQDPSIYSKNKGGITFDTNRGSPCSSSDNDSDFVISEKLYVAVAHKVGGFSALPTLSKRFIIITHVSSNSFPLPLQQKAVDRGDFPAGGRPRLLSPGHGHFAKHVFGLVFCVGALRRHLRLSNIKGQPRNSGRPEKLSTLPPES